LTDCDANQASPTAFSWFDLSGYPGNKQPVLTVASQRSLVRNRVQSMMFEIRSWYDSMSVVTTADC
ncbi:MAG: hypothetical protein VX273_00080, partial [Acidobacteriota bacterium]|nr:hypothetical protein [Acidobacteriota bacterium]